jgi:hypothetical protein
MVCVHAACGPARLLHRLAIEGDKLMMDLLFVIVIVGFFAGAIAYVKGCERL